MANEDRDQIFADEVLRYPPRRMDEPLRGLFYTSINNPSAEELEAYQSGLQSLFDPETLREYEDALPRYSRIRRKSDEDVPYRRRKTYELEQLLDRNTRANIDYQTRLQFFEPKSFLEEKTREAALYRGRVPLGFEGYDAIGQRGTGLIQGLNVRDANAQSPDTAVPGGALFETVLHEGLHSLRPYDRQMFLDAGFYVKGEEEAVRALSYFMARRHGLEGEAEAKELLQQRGLDVDTPYGLNQARQLALLGAMNLAPSTFENLSPDEVDKLNESFQVYTEDPSFFSEAIAFFTGEEPERPLRKGGNFRSIGRSLEEMPENEFYKLLDAAPAVKLVENPHKIPGSSSPYIEKRDIQKRQDGGPMDKDNLDMAVEAYEDLPMLAQIGMGMTPAGVAADAASVGKYARDLERALSVDDREAARDAALNMGMSGVGFVPGIGDAAAAMMRRGRGSTPRGPSNPQMDQDALIGRFLNIRGQLRREGEEMRPQTRQRLREELRVLGDTLTDMGMDPRQLRDGGSVESKSPGIGNLVYNKYINPVQGFRRGGGAMGGRNFGVEREPLNPYAAMIAARDAKGAATPARGSSPGAIKKGPQPAIGPATARMPPEQEAAMRAATGNYAVGDALRAEGFLPTRGPEVVLPAQTTVSTPLASELMMEPAAVPEDIVSRGTVGPVAPLPEPEPTIGPISAPPPGGPSAPPPRIEGRVEPAIAPPQPVGPITAAPAMDLFVQPDGSVMPGADQQMVQPMTDGEGVPVDLGERIMAGEFREPVQELVDQGVIGSPQTAGEQLAQTGTGGDFGLETVAPGQNLQEFSYDNFDPNEVSYVRALFTQMGLDPDQNQIALQETLQNQFGTGAQVSGETLQLTFGNSDNSLLDAMGAVGTYGQFLDSLAQTAPGSGTGTTGDPVVGGTDLNVQPGGEILPGADDQGPLEPVGTDQTAGEQLAEETGGDFGLDEVKPGQNLQDFSYDNFDPNEVGYVRSLLTQMGIDPDQNELVLQELLQNQFGTGAEVSGETLQLTFGNPDNSLLDAMGVVGTYGDYLDSLNQPPPTDSGTGTGTGDQLPGEDLAGQDPAPADPYPGLITEGIVDGQFGYYRYDPETMTDSSQAEFVPLSFEEYMGIFAPGQEDFGKMYGSSGSYEQLPMEFYQSEQFSDYLAQYQQERVRMETDPNYIPPMSDMGMYTTSDGKYGFSGSNNQLAGAYEAWLATQGGETTPVDPAPVDPTPVDPAPPYEPPPVSEDPPINQDPIFDPDPMPEAPEPTPVEYLSGVTPSFDVQTYIDQATAPIDRSAYTQGIEYGQNLMPGDPDVAGGYRIPVYTPTPRATYPGLTFGRQASRGTTASQNIQAAQMAGAAIGGGGNYGGIPLNFDPNNWQGTSASLPPGVGGAEADQQITCPDGYVLSMENGNYYCQNVQQTGGGMSQAMRGPDRVDPTYVSVATAMNKGGEVMPAGIGSFFPEELVEQMGPGLVSSRERTYTYPSGVTVEETQSTGRFMFGDR